MTQGSQVDSVLLAEASESWQQDVAQQPLLESERLILRPFTVADAAEVQRLAGERRVAELTGNIPHPYADGMAEGWIGSHQPGWAERSAVIYAVTRKESGQLLGTVSLTQLERSQANLGYWLGIPFWGQGYATEAAKRLLAFAFTTLGLPLVFARHLPENQASARVIAKCGFTPCGEATVKIKGESVCLKHHELRAEPYLAAGERTVNAAAATVTG